MRIHLFITAAFIAYAVLTNACMLPVVSAADSEPAGRHAHHEGSREPEAEAGTHHTSDCAHGHCLGHGLPAAMGQEVVVQAGCHEICPAPFRAAFTPMATSFSMSTHPLPPPDPPGHVRTVVLRY